VDTEIKIAWIKNAVADYNKIIDYLIENWSEKVATNFESVIQNKLEILIKYPSMGMASQRIEKLEAFL
jgi:plasmid stabilization system protein ParE